jgi:hypothetical protein
VKNAIIFSSFLRQAYSSNAIGDFQAFRCNAWAFRSQRYVWVTDRLANETKLLNYETGTISLNIPLIERIKEKETKMYHWNPLRPHKDRIHRRGKYSSQRIEELNSDETPNKSNLFATKTAHFVHDEPASQSNIHWQTPEARVFIGSNRPLQHKHKLSLLASGWMQLQSTSWLCMQKLPNWLYFDYISDLNCDRPDTRFATVRNTKLFQIRTLLIYWWCSELISNSLLHKRW